MDRDELIDRLKELADAAEADWPVVTAGLLTMAAAVIMHREAALMPIMTIALDLKREGTADPN